VKLSQNPRNLIFIAPQEKTLRQLWLEELGRTDVNKLTPLFSGTFWDQQDLVLTDIDRIEVIRGPAGALWGANAVNGVVNIMTKRAFETPDAMVHVDTGTPLGQTEFRYLGAQRFTAGGSARDEIRSAQGGFRYDRENASNRNSFTLQGDVYRGAGGR
jgi:iron complex outermembrane receptor protein